MSEFAIHSNFYYIYLYPQDFSWDTLETLHLTGTRFQIIICLDEVSILGLHSL